MPVSSVSVETATAVDLHVLIRIIIIINDIYIALSSQVAAQLRTGAANAKKAVTWCQTNEF